MSSPDEVLVVLPAQDEDESVVSCLDRVLAEKRLNAAGTDHLHTVAEKRPVGRVRSTLPARPAGREPAPRQGVA